MLAVGRRLRKQLSKQFQNSTKGENNLEKYMNEEHILDQCGRIFYNDFNGGECSRTGNRENILEQCKRTF